MNKIITIKCGTVNCYIVSGEENAILVDTGVEKYRKNIIKEIKKYNIELIILTHGHIDHIGNTKYLAEYCGAKIAMNRNDYELSKNNLINTLYSKSLLGKILGKVSERDFKNVKIKNFEPDIFLEDNDSLIEYGINAKVLSLPGHTKGSIGVLIEDRDIIAGDVFMNFFKPQVSLIAEDFQVLCKSIEKIKSREINIIYVGHGKPILASQIFK